MVTRTRMLFQPQREVGRNHMLALGESVTILIHLPCDTVSRAAYFTDGGA